MKVSLIALLLWWPALLVGLSTQVSVDATDPDAQAQKVPMSGSFGSIGYKLPLAVKLASVSLAPSRSNETVMKFTVTNLGKEPMELPLFPNLKPFAPSKKSLSYRVTVLKLNLTLDSGDGALKQERLLAGGASLFGNKETPNSLVSLATGKSLDILVRVAFPTQKQSKGKRIAGHASLQTEKILEIGNEVRSDGTELGAAESEGYVPSTLSPP